MPFAADPAALSRAAGLIARYANATIPPGNTVTSQGETVFASKVSYAAGLLAVPGTYIDHRIWGRYTSSGVTPSITPRIRLGGVELFPTRVITGLLASANAPWHADSRFLVTDAGIVGMGTLVIDDNQVRLFGGPVVTGIDLGQALELVASAQWGQNNCSITLQGMTADVTRPTL